MSGYVFSLTPTFTQGLILGQLSILIILTLILKYLFLDSQPAPPYDPFYVPHVTEKERNVPHTKVLVDDGSSEFGEQVPESTEWFNLVLQQVVETYRSKLRDDRTGPGGDEIARARIERYANILRPQSFVDPIKILSVDLGSSAPRLFNARRHSSSSESDNVDQIEFDMTYTDAVSVSLSTSVLFNYPLPYFARLPISLTISLALFSSTVYLTLPNPVAKNPTITISLSPNFTLDLQTTSLMGSRAKLADVPKLHEMIQSQLRKVLAERASWTVVMPGVAKTDEVKDNMVGR